MIPGAAAVGLQLEPSAVAAHQMRLPAAAGSSPVLADCLDGRASPQTGCPLLAEPARWRPTHQTVEQENAN